MNFGCASCDTKTKGFFCGLDTKLMQDVGGQKQIHRFKRGQVIYSEGAPVKGLYCVDSGKVKILKINPDGKEAIFQIKTRGDLLGFCSLFRPTTKYLSTAIALEDSQICFLEKKFVTEAFQSYPNLLISLIKKLSIEMNQAETKLSAMLSKNVRERLAELLFSLTHTFGSMEDDRIRLDLRLTREELASMIGTVSETVTRCITEFKNEGLIEEEGWSIYILDEEKLIKFANIKGDPQEIYET